MIFWRDPIADLLGEWSVSLCVQSVLLRLFVSLCVSAVIGCERSSNRHSAGLRTFILVTFTSCLVMLLDLFVRERFGGMFLLSAAAILSTSNIAARTLFFSSRSQIMGLTTSVSLVSCCALGLSIGAGLYSITLAGFAILLFCLSYLPSLEYFLKNRSNHFEIHLELKNSMNLQNFVTTIRRLGLRIDSIELNSAYAHSGLSVYSVAISIMSAELKQYKTHKEIIEALSTLDYVYHIEEI